LQPSIYSVTMMITVSRRLGPVINSGNDPHITLQIPKIGFA
jgi:hypothetical protein